MKFRDVYDLTNSIKPLLAGKSPDVIGAVLGDLVSLFVVGHHPSVREQILTLHIDMVRDLMPIAEEEIFPNGSPWESLQ
jgi:hypothetical protein